MMKQISGEKAKDWTQGEVWNYLCDVSDFMDPCNDALYFIVDLLQVSGILKEAGYTEQMVYKF